MCMCTFLAHAVTPSGRQVNHPDTCLAGFKLLTPHQHPTNIWPTKNYSKGDDIPIDRKKMANLNNPIDEAIIPQANKQYQDSTFWEQRYSTLVQQQDGDLITREWLGNYAMFADIFRRCVDKSASILIMGLFMWVRLVGTSLLRNAKFESPSHFRSN